MLDALKRYGMILADNGSSLYVTGAPDPRWDNDDLHALGRVTRRRLRGRRHGLAPDGRRRWPLFAGGFLL